MRKLIYGIIATLVFFVVLKIVFETLYSLDIIIGILTGAYLGFIIMKIYSSILFVLCIYKLIYYRSQRLILLEWLPLTGFALIIVIFSYFYLNL